MSDCVSEFDMCESTLFPIQVGGEDYLIGLDRYCFHLSVLKGTHRSHLLGWRALD